LSRYAVRITGKVLICLPVTLGLTVYEEIDRDYAARRETFYSYCRALLIKFNIVSRFVIATRIIESTLCPRAITVGSREIIVKYRSGRRKVRVVLKRSKNIFIGNEMKYCEEWREHYIS